MDVDAKLKEILRLAEKKPCTGFDAFCIANLIREVQAELKTYNEDMTRVSKRLLELDKKHLELKQQEGEGDMPCPRYSHQEMGNTSDAGLPVELTGDEMGAKK